MEIYNYHPESKIYLGSSLADMSPLEPGQFLIPAFATKLKPLPEKIGFNVVFNNEQWEYQEPAKPYQPTPEEIDALVKMARANAYRNEADPLYFKAQRGESTMEEWLAKVAEIKNRFPDGVMPF